MLGRMPREHGRDRIGAVVWSTLLHLLLVASALHAAGEARSATPALAAPDTSIFYLPPPPETPAGSSGSGASRSLARQDADHTLPMLPRLADLPQLPPSPMEAAGAGDHAADQAREALRQHGTGRGAGPGGAHGAIGGDIPSFGTVERSAVLLPGSPSPAFPDALRRAGVEGRVVLRFVVDSAGIVEPGSQHVVTATHPAFAEAVERVLPRLRFRPAEHRGRRVRQVVELPFVFTLER